MITIDMEMPTCCNECFALDDSGDYPSCFITHESRGYNFDIFTKRMDTCPLKDEKTQSQSVIRPQYVTETYNHFQCPLCKSYVTQSQAYCSRCGTRFTWYEMFNNVNSVGNPHTEAYN